MFTLCKTNIKTTFILFLFTTGASGLFASNPDQENATGNTMPARFCVFQEDTITSKTAIEKKGNIQENEFIVPNRLTNKAINFEVNSDISYFRFDHFVKNESKKMFFQAWIKEKELAHILTETDSLRKTYVNLTNDRKEEISIQILKNEERSIGLNQEIPVLYQNVRDEENRYWQSAPADEITRFREKIKPFKDSVQQIAGPQSGQSAAIIQDTIVFYNPSQKTAIKAEPLSGIIYKIQVGAWKGKVPDSASKSIKKLSVIRKVENFKDEKGVVIYTAGNLKKYEEAVTMLNQVKQEGIKNATITAYQNGKKITINEARKLNKEL